MKYSLFIPLSVQADIRILPPLLKKQIRAGLELIQEDPHLGKPLKEELRGFWSYHVNRYRIVYRIIHHSIEVQVIDLGPRAVIYERILALARRSKSA
ncbi:MAG TPA: type II toxin-antitoxin system RelE/ParE family toxin [bacterium]|nr:type II toxin-antitoxin system RelE/ParE family toxin [bacterium]